MSRTGMRSNGQISAICYQVITRNHNQVRSVRASKRMMQVTDVKASLGTWSLLSNAAYSNVRVGCNGQRESLFSRWRFYLAIVGTLLHTTDVQF